MAVARVIEVSATSDQGFEAAVQEGINRANKTLRNVTSAWVKDLRVNLDNGRVRDYQVNLLITFILDDSNEEMTGR
ncbi:MAG: hypothetical protein KatS3mg060_0469 [Dehalococcoidia bacterium]|jgi:flavin-binding protein dodecin|nr:MAG: hypothetical protein KatS3mg060_0469 [Dehalococcoidia bacterium]